jgi:prepilin-type processing-associated H-X9-DG protein
MGVMMYTQDHDEYLPYNYAYTWGPNCSGPTGQLFWWQDLCRPYVKNEQVYTCPSAATHTLWTDQRPPDTPNPLVRDYIANTSWGFSTADESLVVNGIEYGRPAGGGVAGPFTNNWCNPSHSLASIDDSAGTIMIFDGAYPYTEIWRGMQTDAYFNATRTCSEARDYGTWGDIRPEDERCRDGFVAKRHTGGFNAAFTDGHVKFVRNSRLGDWTRRSND